MISTKHLWRQRRAGVQREKDSKENDEDKARGHALTGASTAS